MRRNYCCLTRVAWVVTSSVITVAVRIRTLYIISLVGTTGGTVPGSSVIQPMGAHPLVVGFNLARLPVSPSWPSYLNLSTCSIDVFARTFVHFYLCPCHVSSWRHGMCDNRLTPALLFYLFLSVTRVILLPDPFMCACVLNDLVILSMCFPLSTTWSSLLSLRVVRRRAFAASMIARPRGLLRLD